MNTLQQELRSYIKQEGASLIGFADITDLPETMRGDYPSAICLAVPLGANIVSQIKNGPTTPYFQEYQRLNTLLWELSQKTADWLTQHGYKAHPKKATSEHDEFDRKTLSVPLPHKAVALRAGLGWIGKSDLLITKTYGAAIRLTTVLHNAPFETAPPITQSQRGNCSQCVQACPAQAITGTNWQAGLKREDLYNAHTCYKKARELCGKINLDATICGICIHACPWTQRYKTVTIS